MNGTGSLTFTITRVGADTTLARIIGMVEAAEVARLPIQAAVDQVVALFVPVVIGLALLTVVAWLARGPSPALVAGVSVLIIACPCSKGLATPTWIMVGTGRAAEFGVLFRRAAGLQALDSVKVVAFDETDTLTQGRPEVTDLEPLNGADPDAILRFVAAVEARSEHPIGEAVVRAAHAGGVARADALDFESLTGRAFAPPSTATPSSSATPD